MVSSALLHPTKQLGPVNGNPSTSVRSAKGFGKLVHNVAARATGRSAAPSQISAPSAVQTPPAVKPPISTTAPSNTGSNDPPADTASDQASAAAPAPPIGAKAAVNVVTANKLPALVIESAKSQPAADAVIILPAPLLPPEAAAPPRPLPSKTQPVEAVAASTVASDTAPEGRAAPPDQNSMGDAPPAVAPADPPSKPNAAESIESAPQPIIAEHNLPAHSADRPPIVSHASSSHSPAAQLSGTILRFSADKSGEQRLSVKLTPEELGKVEISLSRAKSGATSVSITAERAATLSLLTNDQRTLERSLDHAGVAAEGRSLSFCLMDQDRRPSSHPDARAKQSSIATPSSAIDAPDRPITRLGLVNITA